MSKSGPGSGPRKRPAAGPGGPPPRRREMGPKPPGPGRLQAQPHRAKPGGLRPGPGGPRPGQESETDSDTPQRLQKVLAHAGLGSRRECEEYILQGRVTVDGKVVRELGTRVDPDAAAIAVDGEKVRLEKMVYYAVNKPKGYVSTNDDPAGRPRVVDLLPEVPERVYSVGRLDEDSTGLMILTNDGELANRLAHPRYGVEKTYRALVAGSPSREILDKLTEGIWLSDGKVRAKRARFAGSQGEATTLELVLAEGKKREIRRMLAKLGHKVMSLTRVAIGPVLLKGLSAGEHRPLTRTEIDLLRKVAAGDEVGHARSSERHGSRPSSGPRPPGRGPRGSGTRPQSGEGEGRAPHARRRNEDRPRPDRDRGDAPRAPRPHPGGSLHDRPIPKKPMPGAATAGKPMPGIKPVPGAVVSGKPASGKPMPARKPMPGAAMPGKPMPGRKPMPGMPIEGRSEAPGPAAKPARPLPPPGRKPGPPSRPAPPSRPTTPAVTRPQPEAGEPSTSASRPPRRIIGLAPKVAEEAGLSLSGRPSRKRPGIGRRPPRKVFGIRRPGEGEDEG